MAENLEFVNKNFEFLKETVQVIKDSFGPNGLDTLVSTTSGTLMLTNDGFQVVRSLSQRSPVGKFVFQGLDLFYKNTGDFSKKFMLLIRELLGEILNNVSVDQSRSNEQLLCISQGINGLLYSVIPIVFDKLQTVGVIYERKWKIDDGISILKSSISGKFSSKTCDILVDLIRQLLFVDELSNDIAYLKQATDKLLDNFSDTVWEVAGKPLTSSVVLLGIIIPREFLTMLKKLPRSPESSSFKFVILGSAFGYDLPQSNTVLSLKDSQHVNNVLEWRRKHIENVVQVLAKHGVELILASLALHETFVHICNQHHIAAIHLIPQEDITRISNIFGTNLLFDLEEDLTSFIAVATSCKSIQVGRHVYVHIQPTKMLSKQILLYAPTETLCHQYSIALQNMLKVLRSAFKQFLDKSYVFSYVFGGGTFELVLSYALEEYRKVNKLNPNIQIACEILEKALLSIPRQLANNADCRLSIFDLKAKTRQALTAGKHVCGLDRKGGPSFMGDEGIIEPTMANYMLVSSVLQLCVQMLRTDRIVHVKKLPSKNDRVDCDDSDSEV